MMSNASKIYYEVLNTLLSNSDKLYIQGRLLWLKQAYTGAGNFLWLSTEQLIKLLIAEAMLKDEKYDPSPDRDKICKKLECKFRKMNHHLDTLSEKYKKHVSDRLDFFLDPDNNVSYDKTYNKDIENKPLHNLLDIPALKLIRTLFDRRYYENKPATIGMDTLKDIDRVYLSLRSKTNIKTCEKWERQNSFNSQVKTIKPALIDEILIRKSFNLGFSRDFHQHLFDKNPSIPKDKRLNKSYDPFIYEVGDGRKIYFDGTSLSKLKNTKRTPNKSPDWR